MNTQNNVKQQGIRDYKKGIKKSANPYQYAPDIFKQAAWVTGWNEAHTLHTAHKILTSIDT